MAVAMRYTCSSAVSALGKGRKWRWAGKMLAENAADVVTNSTLSWREGSSKCQKVYTLKTNSVPKRSQKDKIGEAVSFGVDNLSWSILVNLHSDLSTRLSKLNHGDALCEWNIHRDYFTRNCDCRVVCRKPSWTNQAFMECHWCVFEHCSFIYIHIYIDI